MQHNNENEKYFLNEKLLRQRNILSVRYHSSNRYKIPHMLVSDHVKDAILQLMKNGKVEDTQLVEAIANHKRDSAVFQKFLHVFNREVDNFRDTSLRELYENYNVLRGEIEAGNSSKALKTQLRSVVMELMSLGQIPKRQGSMIIEQLCN